MQSNAYRVRAGAHVFLQCAAALTSHAPQVTSVTVDLGSSGGPVGDEKAAGGGGGGAVPRYYYLDASQKEQGPFGLEDMRWTLPRLLQPYWLASYGRFRAAACDSLPRGTLHPFPGCKHGR